MARRRKIEEEIFEYIDEEVARRGVALARAGAVHGLTLDPQERSIQAEVLEDGVVYHPSVENDEGEVMLACTCIESRTGMCAHMAALLEHLSNADSGGEQGEPQAGRPAAKNRQGSSREPVDEFAGEAASQPILNLPKSPALEELVSDYREVLSVRTVADLRTLAQRRGVLISGTRRDPLLDVLSERLVFPESIYAAVGRLTPAARWVLDGLYVLGQGRSSRVDGGLYLEPTLRVLDPQVRERFPGARATTCLEELDSLGLVSLRQYELRLPLALQVGLPANAGLIPIYSSPVEEERSAAPFELVRLAVRLLLTGQADPPSVRPPQKKTDWGGWPSDPSIDPAMDRWQPKRAYQVPPPQSFLAPESLRRLEQETAQPPEKLDYLARLLHSAGLWQPNARHSLEVQERLLRAFIALPQEQQGRLLFQAGLDLSTWSEIFEPVRGAALTLMREAYSNLTFAAYLDSLRTARKALFRILALAPTGAWLDFEQLLRYIYAVAIDPSTSQPGLPVWLARRGERANPQRYESWRESYARLYSSILESLACWLGVCKLGYTRDLLVAYQVTPLGAYLLGTDPAYIPPLQEQKGAALRFASEQELELDPGAASAEVVSLVLLMGSLQPVGEPGTGGVRWLRYLLTPAGAGRVFEQGWVPGRIQAVLERAARSSLPQGMSDRLQLWWSNFGQFYIYREIALVELSDGYVLNELLAGTPLSRHLLYVFNPRLVAVRPESVEELIAELQAAGYTPRLRGENTPGEPL